MCCLLFQNLFVRKVLVFSFSFPVWIASFNYSPGSSVYVDFSGQVAAVPAGGTFVATSSTLNPGQRTVLAGDSISAITADTTADVVIELYPTNY